MPQRPEQHGARQGPQQSIPDPAPPRIIGLKRQTKGRQRPTGQGENSAAQLNPGPTSTFRPPGTSHQKAVADQQISGGLIVEPEQIPAKPLRWSDKKRGEIEAQLGQATQAIAISLQVIRHQIRARVIKTVFKGTERGASSLNTLPKGCTR